MEHHKMDQATNLRKIVKLESDKIYQLRKPPEDGLASGINDPKVITIASGKGGVGKTNVVVNLAIACQRLGKKVLIFDADLGLANIDIIFGLDPKYTIEDIISGQKDLAQVIVQGPEGVSIIPASSGVQELTNLTEGQKMNLLNEFDMLNNMYDILLIDTGAGVSSNVVYFNLAAEERIIVVTPEPTSITDAYALMKIMFSQHGVKNFYLLMNMVSDEREAKTVFDNLSGVLGRFMRGISIDYAGYIPRDACLQNAVKRRKPVICSYPEAPSSKGFEVLAKYIVTQTNRKSSDGNIKFFWKRLLTGTQDINNESYVG
jgi:flagellar biosynthesis protein FlhG